MNLPSVVVLCFAMSHLTESEGKPSKYTLYTLPQLCDSKQTHTKPFNETTFKMRTFRDFLKKLNRAASAIGCANYKGTNEGESTEFKQSIKLLKGNSNMEGLLKDIQKMLCTYHNIWLELDTKWKQSIEDKPNREKGTQRDTMRITLLNALCALEKQGIFSGTCNVSKELLDINKGDVCIKQDSRKKEMMRYLKKAISKLRKIAEKKRGGKKGGKKGGGKKGGKKGGKRGKRKRDKTRNSKNRKRNRVQGKRNLRKKNNRTSGGKKLRNKKMKS